MDVGNPPNTLNEDIDTSVTNTKNSFYYLKHHKLTQIIYYKNNNNTYLFLTSISDNGAMRMQSFNILSTINTNLSI